jgi:hypothetical protein
MTDAPVAPAVRGPEASSRERVQAKFSFRKREGIIEPGG